jgi:hypothetical protein
LIEMGRASLPFRIEIYSLTTEGVFILYQITGKWLKRYLRALGDLRVHIRQNNIQITIRITWGTSHVPNQYAPSDIDFRFSRIESMSKLCHI